MSFDRIVFEYPDGWIDPGGDPLYEQHLQCLETIKLAANQLGLDFLTKTSLRMADFAPRVAPDNSLLISVHTVGVSRNVVRLKESYLPGYYYFDRTGYSGWAELAFNINLQNQASCYDLRNGIEFVENMRTVKLCTNSSKYIQPKCEREIVQYQSKRKYIFFALQTTDDLVACLSNINQLVLAETLAEIVGGLNMNLVIKRHPYCNDVVVGATIDRLKKIYKCVTISNDSINSLILGAKAVVTVNSGVGFEALVMGVPVITAGRSDYSFVTRSISKKEDLSELPSLIEEMDRVRICSVIKYYLEQYCFTCGDLEKTKKLILRWQNTEYSSMQNLHGYENNVLQEAQEHISSIENIRRSTLLFQHKTLLEYRVTELIKAICIKIKRKIFGVS